jgi:formyltetrahydrofolate deformylase
MSTSSFVLTLSCVDRIGIVSNVTRLLADARLNITESQQFGDPSTGLFFMRVQLEGHREDVTAAREGISAIGDEFSMSWQLHDMSEGLRMLVLVSRFGHCLNDLLYRHRIGALRAEIPAVASNHPDFAELTGSYGIDFRHLPIDKNDPAGKGRQETALLQLIDTLRIDLVVLARYMQVLSPTVVAHLEGRAINIHHGLLPSFKGAKPYQQAFDRGVKIIGATAHYVTSDLDEGPIISQAVAHVDHGAGSERLAAIGRDVECQALARAVEWHLEHRVLMNGSKTVVFSS